MTRYGLLDAFDVVFARSFTCLLPPPYDTAWEVSEKIADAIDTAARNVYLIRRNLKRKYRKRLSQ